MRKVLFICLHGLHRSRTTADMFSSWPNCETKSAGQLDSAPFPLSQEDLILQLSEFKRYLAQQGIFCFYHSSRGL